MRILVAPDKFKGCLAAREVARAIADGLHDADAAVELDLCPLADGGEGTVDALVSATTGTLHRATVTGPLPAMRVDASFGVLGDNRTAVIEMSAASGLHLLRPDQYNPLRTTTFGTGELLLAAASLPGIQRIIVGIGGSATVDGGIGCAQACGIKFGLLDAAADPGGDDRALCGGDIRRIAAVKAPAASHPLARLQITVACDVTNPLCGPRGAAPVFGPQKGATPEMVRRLDDDLAWLAHRLNLDDAANLPGSGAAGGLGFAMVAFLGATIQSGFDVVAQAADLERRIAWADLVITGEGRLDAQTVSGKTIAGVARLCAMHRKPCTAIAGQVCEDAARLLARAGWPVSCHSLTDRAGSAGESIRRARELLRDTAREMLEPHTPEPPGGARF